MVVLFRAGSHLDRSDIETLEEYRICCNHCETYQYRSNIPKNSLVVGRYSVLPFYEELEKELESTGSRLINSYEQHQYIADITQWYKDVKEYTPKTFTEWGALGNGKWVVKGKTNSRKFQWNTHMFADGREQLVRVINRLFDDSFIVEQNLVVREYIPLKKVGEGINGLPITREWRCFFLGKTLIASGYYWASHPECDQGPLPLLGKKFAEEVANIVASKTNFFVLDVAEKESGGWVLIEINDGQMSGLSCVDPNELYQNLKANEI